MSGGLVAQYGFLYQKHVYILMALQYMAADTFFTYEGVDDIDIEKDNPLHAVSIASKSFIQVKSGTVNESCMIRIVGNWMNTDDYTLNRENREISLYVENEIGFDYKDTAFAEQVVTAFKAGKTMKKGSIMRTAHDKYQSELSNPTFVEQITAVLNTITVKSHSFDELSKKLLSKFCIDYCGDIHVFELAKQKRLDRLVSYMGDEIDNAISNKQPFVLRYNHFIRMIQKVSEEISDTKYTIDVSAMKKKMRPEAEKIVEEQLRREVQQLNAVDKQVSFVIEGVLQQMLYKDFRDVYSINDAVSVSNIENEAKENYDDAIFSLDDEERSPRKIYLSTIGRTIESDFLPSGSIYRKGCYIYLTRDDISDELQISWEVDDAK